ncbi:hypothetical protein [Couchioplanes caeruleus]|uniref:Uncharacterized protein n=2 Tax=Couchioplanes caeruleus TaxID=56438 RepID=A0A1K0FK15_9ACTN|nr:hypothetical protein [Couchioplanes caeruleus]OJF13197.1 hypothetical protein BG844_16415 [Couchioplanes caeruleus subsp. caeruleus]ROP27756.1 hypothetical protein EDD30_0451 [Couchioplanes caeruleus]
MTSDRGDGAPEPWSLRWLRLAGLFTAACTDLLAPLALAGGSEGRGFLTTVVFVTGFAGILAAPVLLLFLDLPVRWLKVVLVGQLIVGPTAFCAGSEATRSGYLHLLGRPVAARVVDSEVACGASGTGPAGDRDATCAKYLYLERPDGTPVAGPPLVGGRQRVAGFATDDEPVPMVEDRLGLVRAAPAGAGGGPHMSPKDWAAGVVLMVGWLVLLSGLAAGTAERLRGRSPRGGPASVPPS